jgi:hypothetical protein
MEYQENPMTKQIEPDKSILLAEYGEAGAAMRAHADTRWKLLGVVIPISGGILALSVQFPELKIPLNFIGLITACIFALIEYRTQLTWHVFFSHAVETEEKLGIVGAYTKMKPQKQPWYHIDSTRGIRLGYFALIAYWVYAIIVLLA